MKTLDVLNDCNINGFLPHVQILFPAFLRIHWCEKLVQKATRRLFFSIAGFCLPEGSSFYTTPDRQQRNSLTSITTSYLCTQKRLAYARVIISVGLSLSKLVN